LAWWFLFLLLTFDPSRPSTPTSEQAEMAKYDYRKNGHKEELDLALCQLKIWAQDHRAKSVFGKVFTLFNFKILVKVNFLLEQNRKSFI
ncbi:6462_t:CDS:2, partial [Gigaspora margarita]